MMMHNHHQLHHGGGATTSHSGGSEAISTPQPSWYRREKECIVSASASSSVSPCLVAYVPNSPILGITDSHHHRDSNNNSQNPEHQHQQNPVSNSEEGSSSPHPPSIGGGGTSGRGSVGSLPPTVHREDDNSSPSRSPSKGAPNAPLRQQFARFPVGNSVLSMMSEDDYMYSAHASPRQQAASFYSPTSSIRGSLNLGQASPTMMGGYNSSQTASLQQSPLKEAAAGTSTTPLGGEEEDDVRHVQHVLSSGRTAQQQQRGNQHHHSDNYNAVYLLGTQEMSECSLTGSSLKGSNTALSSNTLTRPIITNENAAASDSGVVSAFGSSMALSMAAPSPNRRHSMGGSSSMNARPSPIAHAATSPPPPPAAATTTTLTNPAV